MASQTITTISSNAASDTSSTNTSSLNSFHKYCIRKFGSLELAKTKIATKVMRKIINLLRQTNPDIEVITKSKLKRVFENIDHVEEMLWLEDGSTSTSSESHSRGRGKDNLVARLVNLMYNNDKVAIRVLRLMVRLNYRLKGKLKHRKKTISYDSDDTSADIPSIATDSTVRHTSIKNRAISKSKASTIRKKLIPSGSNGFCKILDWLG